MTPVAVTNALGIIEGSMVDTSDTLIVIATALIGVVIFGFVFRAGFGMAKTYLNQAKN